MSETGRFRSWDRPPKADIGREAKAAGVDVGKGAAFLDWMETGALLLHIIDDAAVAQGLHSPGVVEPQGPDRAALSGMVISASGDQPAEPQTRFHPGPTADAADFRLSGGRG